MLDLWWWRYDSPAPAAFADLLDDAERRRAAAFRFPVHAARFVWARGMAKSALAAAAGVPAGRVRLVREGCPDCGGRDHGKPSAVVPGDRPGAFQFSLSHSEGHSALVLARGHPVGLDVERIRPMAVDVLAPATLSPSERAHVADQPAGPPRSLAYLRCWTRKEAVLKASGAGVRGDLTALEVAPAEEPARVAHAFGSGPAHWTVAGGAVADGLLAAVAVPEGADPAHRLRSAAALHGAGTQTR
ncbi:4'-phosphopantetheinyl transferase superfamily protein [Streptomyces sp. NPDC089919]|uniref:4'-phosphopantetheinyl transferase family protein n=1 Tax=Streptomyces sp. NPDC089919 TaxID=3155188 RepID=UPI003417056E